MQAAPDEIWRGFAPGDFLFIGLNHVLMPGSDVNFLFNRVLPFLPDDYPADWQWLGYNEQLAVAPFLAGGGFKALFASYYVRPRMAADLGELKIYDLPLPVRESTFWMVKT